MELAEFTLIYIGEYLSDLTPYKRKFSNDRCPDSVHFDTLLLMIYSSDIETLIGHGEIEFYRIYFLRFCTKYVTRFSKYRIELIVVFSSRNATKIYHPEARLQ